MESLADGSQNSSLIKDEDFADTKYSMDGAEASMVTLVDGKLTPIGDTHDDVTDDQLLNNTKGSDEERGLRGNEGVQYETSAAALRGTDVIDPTNAFENPMAEAELTGNPDAGADVETGLPSEDAPLTTSAQTDDTPNDRVQPNGSDLNRTETFTVTMMMPQIDPMPAYPNPSTPPAVPDAPAPVEPVPYSPEFPGTPTSPQPDIAEPVEPGQPEYPHGPERIGFVTYTSSVGGPVSPDDNLEPGESTAPADRPGSQYEGMSAKPNTGRSARPYDADANDNDSYQPGERPNEARQMQQPHPPVDESSVMEENMLAGTDRTEYKSTDGL